jgi:hypothetical protein
MGDAELDGGVQGCQFDACLSAGNDLSNHCYNLIFKTPALPPLSTRLWAQCKQIDMGGNPMTLSRHLKEATHNASFRGLKPVRNGPAHFYRSGKG